MKPNTCKELFEMTQGRAWDKTTITAKAGKVLPLKSEMAAKPCRYCGDPSHEANEPSATCIATLQGDKERLLTALRFVKKYANMKAEKYDDLPKQLTNQITAALAACESEGGK